jgi:hypothetical protein
MDFRSRERRTIVTWLRIGIDGRMAADRTLTGILGGVILSPVFAQSQTSGEEIVSATGEGDVGVWNPRKG